VQERDAILKRKPAAAVEVIPPEELEKIDEIVERYHGLPNYIIPALKTHRNLRISASGGSGQAR